MTVMECSTAPVPLLRAIMAIACTATQENVPIFYAGTVYSVVRGQYTALEVLDALDALCDVGSLRTVGNQGFRLPQ